MVEYEYLVYDEYGNVLFAYDNEEDALTRAYSQEGWNISRHIVEDLNKKEEKYVQNT